MHAPNLAQILSNPSHPSPPLARRVSTPHRPCDPTWQPHGCTLAPFLCPCSGSPRGSPPRAPHSLSVSPTKQARATPSQPLACSPGEATPSLVYPHRPATPNLFRPHQSGHGLELDSTLPPCPSRSCTRIERAPRTPLAQPLALPCTLRHHPSCQTPARRRDPTRVLLPFPHLRMTVSSQNSTPHTLRPCTAPPPPPSTNPCPRHPTVVRNFESTPAQL
jgi:hypothetical protein